MKQATLKNRLIFCLVITAILLAFYIVKAFTEGLASNYFAIALLSIGAVVIIAYLKSGTDKYRKLKELLENDCSPEAFAMEILTMLNRESEKKHPRNKLKLSVCLAEGLYASGRFQEALDTLITAEPSMRSARGKADIVRWHHYFILVCLELGKLDTARKAAADLEEALVKFRLGNAASFYRRKYEEDICLIELAEGNYERAEDVFKEAFLWAQCDYDRVFAAYNRARAYEHAGKDARAREFYAYVAENGNTLYIAKKAAQRLGLTDGKA